jgi:hypothetical protein
MPLGPFWIERGGLVHHSNSGVSELPSLPSEPGTVDLLVPVEGIEPPLLAEHDFESCASTSSATRAERMIQKSGSRFSDKIMRLDTLYIIGLAASIARDHVSQALSRGEGKTVGPGLPLHRGAEPANCRNRQQ